MAALSSVSRYWLLLTLLVPTAALAQTAGVGIGTTAPDASAALDIVSSSKGALLPRVTSASAIASPATGLIVYQTAGTAGFYYNAGSPTSPNWQRLIDAATASGQFIQNQTGASQAAGFRVAGNGYVGGRVGVGTISPQHPLTVQANSGNLLLGFNDASGTDKYNFSRTAPTSSGATVVPGGLNLSESGVASGRLYVQDGSGNVGVGSTAPSKTLDVNGSVRVRSLTAGVVQAAADGTLSNASTVGAADATTASNGLTRTGQDVALGGTLSQNTTLTQNGNAVQVVGAGMVPRQISQLTSSGIYYTTGPAGLGQSFTLPAGAIVTQVDVYCGGGTGTFRFYQGTPTGTELLAQTVTYNGGYNLTSIVLNTPITITTAGTYSFLTGSGSAAYGYGNPYSGGSFQVPYYSDPTIDLAFVVHYTAIGPVPSLYVGNGNTVNVGVGTDAPGATLDVNGSTRLRGLTTAGLVTTDASGNLSSQALPTPPSGTDFIQNQTATDQAGSFRLTGNGALAGNLGIGTSSPSTRLSISPSTTEAKITLYEGGGTDHYGFGVSGGQLNYHVLSTSDQHVFYAKGRNADTGSIELMRIQGNGRVGIGTSNPTQTLDVAGSATLSGRLGIGVSAPMAPLHVSGSASVAAVGQKVYFFQGSSTLGGDNSTAARAVAAYFTGGQVFVNDFIVAGALNVTSDRRIKRVIGLSDRAADLALLQQVRITDYTYIDQHANTDKVVKKVIAQEVQALLPAAVSQSRQAIPNVYERAARVSYADGFITLTTTKPHELPAGGGTLRLYTPANQELTVAATVVDAHTVRFASAEAHADSLFVYGKYVDDFLSVDYDALTTLNVSATQELARQVAELQQQNAALLRDNATLKTGAAADHADLQTVKEQLARLLGDGAANGAQARK